MSKSTTLQDLVALANLVTTSVDAIVKSCGDSPFPSLDETFDFESEAIRVNPDVQKHTTVALAAATQLVATLRSPLATLLLQGFAVSFLLPCDLIHRLNFERLQQFYTSASIRTSTELHVPEILRQAGPQVSRDVLQCFSERV